jgi:hypothetical protein
MLAVWLIVFMIWVIALSSHLVCLATDENVSISMVILIATSFIVTYTTVIAIILRSAGTS